MKVKAFCGLSADYIHDLRQRLTRFAAKFGANPATITDPEARAESGNDTRNRGVDISTTTTADVQGFLDRLKLGPQSVKNFRTVLHTRFEFAEARGNIFKGSNPVVGTESVKVQNGKIQVFTPDEIAALLKAASPNFLPLVAIGAFASLRAAEAGRTSWRDVDVAGGFIHVASDKAKAKARRLIPIRPNLAKWLASYAARTGMLCPATSDELQDARAKCVKASGVKWKANALRHSFASYRLAVTQNAASAAVEMGNSADVVFNHYREIVRPEAATAWFNASPAPPA